MMALIKVCHNYEYKKLSDYLIQEIFRYTDDILEDNQNLHSKKTGIFNGESSIVYTYLVLYSISGDEKSIRYAKKHCQIICSLMNEDQYFDLLDGNAGAIIAMIHMHTITQEPMYLEEAKRAADLLMRHAAFHKYGVGWILPGQSQPLAGMAHGNSSIALAFAQLWMVTHRVIDKDERRVG